MDRDRIIALSKTTLAVVVWGTSFIATKVALQDVSPETIVWLRFAVGVALLGAVVVARGELSLPDRRELGHFALLGLIGITFHQWLQSTGLVTAQASTTGWIVATTPIFIALLGWLVLQEKLGRGRVMGITLAAVGVLIVVTKGNLSSLTAGQFGAPGDLLILISAPNWAVFSVLSRRVLHYPESASDAPVKQPTAARMIFYVMGIGWLFTSIQLFLGPGLGEIKQLTASGWLGIGFLGIFCSGLAYIFWYDALRIMPASQVGAFLYLEPLVTVVVAAAVLGESITFASLLGGGVILLGVWVVGRPARNSQDDT